MASLATVGQVIAGAGTIGLALVHQWVGGPEIAEPIAAAPLAPEVRAVAAVVWQAVTALLLLDGIAIIAGLWWPSRAVLAMATAQNAAFAALFLVRDVTVFGDILTLPQWIGFAVVIAAAVPALRRPMPRASG